MAEIPKDFVFKRDDETFDFEICESNPLDVQFVRALDRLDIGDQQFIIEHWNTPEKRTECLSKPSLEFRSKSYTFKELLQQKLGKCKLERKQGDLERQRRHRAKLRSLVPLEKRDKSKKKKVNGRRSNQKSRNDGKPSSLVADANCSTPAISDSKIDANTSFDSHKLSIGPQNASDPPYNAEPYGEVANNLSTVFHEHDSQEHRKSLENAFQTLDADSSGGYTVRKPNCWGHVYDWYGFLKKHKKKRYCSPGVINGGLKNQPKALVISQPSLIAQYIKDEQLAHSHDEKKIQLFHIPLHVFDGFHERKVKYIAELEPQIMDIFRSVKVIYPFVGLKKVGRIWTSACANHNSVNKNGIIQGTENLNLKRSGSRIPMLCEGTLSFSFDSNTQVLAVRHAHIHHPEALVVKH